MMSPDSPSVSPSQALELLRVRLQRQFARAVDEMPRYYGTYIDPRDFVDDVLLIVLDEAVATEPVLQAEQAALDEILALQAELSRLRAPSRATPEEDIVERLKMDLTTETTMHAAWRKRAEEAERGTPVDPAALEPFLREMREVTIPAIVEVVYQRQRAAAVVHPPLRASRATSAAQEPQP